VLTRIHPPLAPRWGFTRVEDICWIKTNKDKAKTGRPYLSADFQEANSMLTHTTVRWRLAAAALTGWRAP
jgi:hypothetical protein